MRPKPFSIHHPFIVLEAVSLALAVWLLGGALYALLQIQGELAEPVANLEAALPLNRRLEAALDDLLVVAQNAQRQPSGEPGLEFNAASGRVSKLMEGYRGLKVPRDQRLYLETMRQLGERMTLEVEHLIRGPGNPPQAEIRLRAIHQMKSQVELLARSLTEEQLQQLDGARARLHEHLRTLFLLLTACGLFAVLAVRGFQRMQDQHLWRPLEQLRQMTVEIRQGRLSVTPDIPRSVEVAPLVESFLSMAAELRAMRQSLEQRVLERTAQLEAAQKQLLQAAKLSALGQLVSGLAHEVNNPLTSILGFSEVVLGHPGLHPQSRAQLETMRHEALRLKNVMAALSSLGRSAPPRTTCVDLREVFDRFVELRQYHWTARLGGQIRLHCARPPAPAWVDGDPDQLLRVLLNLVLNAEQAIQACPRGSGPPGRPCREEGDVWLEVAAADSEVRMTVRDNGAGMSPEIMEHIFEPFFSAWAGGQATGLGLTIAHGIVEQHRGKILPESIEGEGTTMTVILPRAPAPDSGAPQLATHRAQPPAPAEAPRGGHALIIDDEEDISALIQTALAQRGWRSTVLNDSSAVGPTLERAEFDLVICDLKMPGTSGIEVLHLLRQTRPELARRFLLITGDIFDVARESADLSAVSVLEKPFTLRQLREAVHAVMQHANAHQ